MIVFGVKFNYYKLMNAHENKHKDDINYFSPGGK
jgi:hypothetical protein